MSPPTYGVARVSQPRDRLNDSYNDKLVLNKLTSCRGRPVTRCVASEVDEQRKTPRTLVRRDLPIFPVVSNSILACVDGRRTPRDRGTAGPTERS